MLKYRRCSLARVMTLHSRGARGLSAGPLRCSQGVLVADPVHGPLAAWGPRWHVLQSDCQGSQVRVQMQTPPRRRRDDGDVALWRNAAE